MAAGGVAATLGVFHLADPRETTTASWAVGLLVVAGAIGLVAGFMTPGAAVAVSLTTLFIALTWIPPLGATLEVAYVVALLVIVDALALAVLGPGAYSVDARLFGRREIIIPEQSPPADRRAREPNPRPQGRHRSPQ
jgi:uncharacterized membrane protein YphA (DoxX/SURF4 family)